MSDLYKKISDGGQDLRAVTASDFTFLMKNEGAQLKTEYNLIISAGKTPAC